ncbi:membrane protein insertase YidC [Paractinoplanes lichenicola]|uniref:Membrane protein insertase YidC n=1 Tax=Paractinoplanes lichenicola TaxID=2802976 RepID=A0ABS1VM06_9ACTN|nr:membrane protein insertase YidC [Actinoplanes lichenicola]MBL7255760.1 membrane protein insertase YidC [Actinoplanes lichenicola]
MSIVYTVISEIIQLWQSVWGFLGPNWSWVAAIVFVVLTVRVALLPLFVRQMRSQRAMQRLQPELRELQTKHKGDPMALGTAMTELYRKNNVSPYASFVPLLVQAPILFGLFHVLRHLRPTITDPATQTLYGWTTAQFHDASHATLLGAPLASTFSSGGALVAAVLIAAMVTTTFLTMRLSAVRNAPVEDPMQRTIQRVMTYGIPLSLLVSGVIFPVGVLLYWTTQNVFALGQQAWLLRRYPVEIPASR